MQCPHDVSLCHYSAQTQFTYFIILPKTSRSDVKQVYVNSFVGVVVCKSSLKHIKHRPIHRWINKFGRVSNIDRRHNLVILPSGLLQYGTKCSTQSSYITIWFNAVWNKMFDTIYLYYHLVYCSMEQNVRQNLVILPSG